MTTARGGEVEALDGRTARRHRTREAIVDAVSALIDEGELMPTRAQIAERAAVSIRSINIHFEDREQLLAAVAERHLSRILDRLAPVDRSGDLVARVDSFLDQRAAVLEALTNVTLASQVREPSSEILRQRRREMLDLGRREVASVFAREVRRDDDLLAALDVASGSNTWVWLRQTGHSVEGARLVVRRMLLSLLGVAGAPPSVRRPSRH